MTLVATFLGRFPPGYLPPTRRLARRPCSPGRSPSTTGLTRLWKFLAPHLFAHIGKNLGPKSLERGQNFSASGQKFGSGSIGTSVFSGRVQ